jgi:hypothetical protein
VTPPETPAERQERLYREELGEEALDRVRATFSLRHACCWEPNEGPHHPICKNADDPDAPPPFIEGQESLA